MCRGVGLLRLAGRLLSHSRISEGTSLLHFSQLRFGKGRCFKSVRRRPPPLVPPLHTHGRVSILGAAAPGQQRPPPVPAHELCSYLYTDSCHRVSRRKGRRPREGRWADSEGDVALVDGGRELLSLRTDRGCSSRHLPFLFYDWTCRTGVFFGRGAGGRIKRRGDRGASIFLRCVENVKCS